MKGIVVKDVQQLETLDFPVPQAGEGQVVIKVKYCGICGSDRHFWNAAWLKGIILGHEFVGTISDSGTSDFNVGDRVVSMGFNSCGVCEYCKEDKPNLCAEGSTSMVGAGAHGGYAEYVAVRTDMVRKIPDTISDVQGALIEPAAVALHALKISGVDKNSRILITGAGAIGLTVAACAKALGVAFVGTTARNPERIEAAKKRPYVDVAFDGTDPNLKDTIREKAGKITHVMECSGADALFKLAIDVIGPQGKIVLVGQPHDDMKLAGMSLFLKEGSVYTSYIFTPKDFDQVITLMDQGKLDITDLASSIVGFDEVQSVFENLESGSSSEIKVLIKV